MSNCPFKEFFLPACTLAGPVSPCVGKKGQNKNSFVFGNKSSRSVAGLFCLPGFMGGLTTGVRAAARSGGDSPPTSQDPLWPSNQAFILCCHCRQPRHTEEEEEKEEGEEREDDDDEEED